MQFFFATIFSLIYTLRIMKIWHDFNKIKKKIEVNYIVICKL